MDTPIQKSLSVHQLTFIANRELEDCSLTCVKMAAAVFYFSTANTHRNKFCCLDLRNQSQRMQLYNHCSYQITWIRF